MGMVSTSEKRRRYTYWYKKAIGFDIIVALSFAVLIIARLNVSIEYIEPVIEPIEFTTGVPEIIDETQVVAPLPTKEVTEDADDAYIRCNCVAYIRSKGIDIRGVDAKWFDTFPPKTPQIGGVVVQRYIVSGTEVYHLSYIEDFVKEGILVSESNFKRCQYTTRVLPFNDPHIIRFWKP